MLNIFSDILVTCISSLVKQLLMLSAHFLVGYLFFTVQFSSVTHSCPTLSDPMDCSMPGLPFHHQLPELLKFMSIELVMPSNFCRLHLLPLSIFPNITVFSNESVLCIRWPKYWSFSFSVSPSDEYSGLISFRMDWLDLFLSKELSRVFFNTTLQ